MTAEDAVECSGLFHYDPGFATLPANVAAVCPYGVRFAYYLDTVLYANKPEGF